MKRTTGLALILIVLATAATPASARYYRYYHGGNYNYGGPHYAASDYYHNSRQLVGTR
jgi:hypothetical protein